MIEVLRGVIAEARWRVGDDGLGMDHQIVEGKAVDEGLQGRTRRADGPDHVVLAAARVVEEIAGTDIGPDGAGRVLRHQDGKGGTRLEAKLPAQRQGLKPALEIAIDKALDLAGIGPGGDQPRGQMGRIHRCCEPALGQGNPRCLAGRGRSQDPVGNEPVQHPRPPFGRGCNEAVRPLALGRLGQRHEQGGLGIGKLGRLLAEIEPAGGAQAREVPAIGRQGQIHGQDLILGESLLELQGAAHLDQLGAERPRSRLQQARCLHREGRSAGDDMAGCHELTHGAQQRQGIDAEMPVEALVLIGEQHAPEARVDGLGRHRQAPAAVGGGEGTQELAVLVRHQNREVAQARQVRREKTVEDGGAGAERENQCARAEERNAETAPVGERLHHRRELMPLTGSLPHRARSSPGPSPCGRARKHDTCPRPRRPAGGSCPASPRARDRRR